LNIRHVEEWTLSKAPYKRNSIVSFNNKYYIAVSKYNAAVPGHLQFKLIYVIFLYSYSNNFSIFSMIIERPEYTWYWWCAWASSFRIYI